MVYVSVKVGADLYIFLASFLKPGYIFCVGAEAFILGIRIV